MLPRMLVTLPALRKQLESLSCQKPPSVIAIFVKHSIFDVICRSLGRASRWLCHAKCLNHQPKPSWKSLVLTWCNWQVLDMDVFLANKKTVTHFFFFKHIHTLYSISCINIYSTLLQRQQRLVPFEHFKSTFLSFIYEFKISTIKKGTFHRQVSFYRESSPLYE